MRSPRAADRQSGAILVDALIALSIVAIVVPAVIGLVGRVSRAAAHSEEVLLSNLEVRNDHAVTRFSRYQEE